MGTAARGSPETDNGTPLALATESLFLCPASTLVGTQLISPVVSYGL